MNCTPFTWIKKLGRLHELNFFNFSDYALWNGLLWSVCFDNRNHRCTNSYALINIMDIRSCCVVVAMVTSKSTKCSTWSVRVSSVTLCLLPCAKAKSCLQLSKWFTLKGLAYQITTENKNIFAVILKLSTWFWLTLFALWNSFHYFNILEVNKMLFMVPLYCCYSGYSINHTNF